MAGAWTTERFPLFADELRRLAEQHRELEDEPLRLAISYDPGRDSQDVFLFEVVEHFGSNAVSPDKELFEVSFGSTSEFSLPQQSQLHLVLTNPNELRAALAEHWPSVEEIRQAVGRGDFVKLNSDETGEELMELLCG